jgi:hypothetical protein
MARQRYYRRPGHPKADELGMVLEEDLGDWDAQQKQKAKEAKLEVRDGDKQGL